MRKFTRIFQMLMIVILSTSLAFGQNYSKKEILSKIGMAPAQEVVKADYVKPGTSVKGSTAWMVGLWTPDFGSCDADLPTTAWSSISSPATWASYAGDFDNLSPYYYYVIDNVDGHLKMIDISNGAIIKDVGNVNLSGYSVTGMACDRTTGIMYLYGLDFNVESYLYTLDLTTGVATLVGGLGLTGLENIIEMAIDGTGSIYAWGLDDNLYRVNPVTGLGTLVGPIGIDISYAQGGNWDPTLDIIYAAAYNVTTSSGEMHQVNKLTGAFTLMEAMLEETDAMGFPNPVAAVTTDVLVGSVDAPMTGILGNAETVSITIYNIGTTTEISIPVSYTLNGGTAVNETWIGSLAPNTSTTYSFTGTADCSVIGPHQIVACTNLGTDNNSSNDCLTYDFATTPSGDCQHEVVLYDDYGDGWNGGLLDVLVNGIVVLDDITIASGYGPESHFFYVSTGDAVTTVYTAGSYAYENYYEIYGDLGTFIIDDGVGGVDPVGVAYTAECEGCCDHQICLTDDYGDGWTGGTVDVYVDGSPVLTGITLATGAGPECYTFTACIGADIDVYYTAGSWGYENYYAVYDGGGGLLGESGAGGVEPGDLLDLVGDCPSCALPTNPAVSTITTVGADFGWTSVDSFFDVYIEINPGTPPDAATTPTLNDVGNPTTWAGGAAATTYDWWVRTDCGQDNINVSDWVAGPTFSTACAANTAFPYLEDFEGAFLPACWSKVVTAPNDITQDAVQNHTPAGLYSARFSSYTTATDYNQYLFSGAHTIDAGYTQLSFWHRKYSTSAELLEWGISTSTDPGTYTWTAVTLSETDWQQTQVDLTAYIGQTVYIGFHYFGSYLYYVYLDDVSIDAIALDAMDWNNLQWPDMATIDVSQNETVYSQGWEPGVTDADPLNPGAGIDVWIGYDAADTDPATWTNWVPATYNVDVGSNDEFMADLGAAQGLGAGTYYYASRWQLNSGPFTYGGYNAGGGGFWDGVTNVNGVLTVNPISNDDCVGAIALTVDYSCNYTTGSNVGATDSGETPSCASYAGGDVWFSAVVPATGYMVVECAENGGFTDGGMSAWTGDCATLLEYECDDDDGAGLFPLIEINDMGLAGETLYFSVWEYGNNLFGPFDICAHTVPATETWTGAAKSNDWHDAGNWSAGVPGPITNVNIPAGVGAYPTISAAASCNDIYFGSNATSTATLLDGGYLTVNGTATVERYFSGNDLDWHLVSSPLANSDTWVFYDMYLQSFDEATNLYTEIVDSIAPTALDVMDGYGLYSTLGATNTASFTGTLNFAPQSNGFTALGAGWNLFGNPFVSSIDWELVTIPAGMSNEVHYIEAATGADLSYVQGVGGPGSQFIPPHQGFFVSATAAGDFWLYDIDRTHDGANIFYKNDNPQLVVLEASNGNFSDQAWIHFNENAGAEHDGQFDAYKKISYANAELPQIFSYTPQGTKLGVNGMQETTMVPVGFTAVQSGEFTISAVETGEFANVVLEDLFAKTQTDLLNDSYTFNYNAGDQENRFIVHFTPLAVPQSFEEMVNIFSYNTDVYVNVPLNTEGDIFIYNVMGQEVASQRIEGTQNIITLEESAYYVVKVLSNESVVTKKVFIK